ncbi:MFS transporter [Paenibacillus planticolens]|uniref:MFS transporter n=1 Tax=Paenibacillus planticolens TaxID=2654976 RepID=A0ABX1ZPX5_9BACL|nr:MFS transporter [Paenibacillus planticolens]
MIAPITIVTTTLLSELFPKDIIGRKIATSQTISWIGPLTGPILGSYLTYYAGWRAVFLAHILLGVLLLLPWLIRKATLSTSKVRPQVQKGITRSKKLIWISLVGGLQFFILFASHTLIPILVRDHLGLDARYAGWVSLSLGIVSMMTFSWGGKMSDRIGPTYTTYWVIIFGPLLRTQLTSAPFCLRA